VPAPLHQLPNRFLFALGQYLHPAVGKVAGPPGHAKKTGLFSARPPEPNTLHPAGDPEVVADHDGTKLALVPAPLREAVKMHGTLWHRVSLGLVCECSPKCKALLPKMRLTGGYAGKCAPAPGGTRSFPAPYWHNARLKDQGYEPRVVGHLTPLTFELAGTHGHGVLSARQHRGPTAMAVRAQAALRRPVAP
jgi:hypothetical protein